MAEYLAFKQIFTKGGTIYRHKSILFTKAITMDSLREDFFSCSGFSGKQYCDISRCHFLG